MGECWVIYWKEIPEGESEEFTAVMTGEGTLPPRPKDVKGDFLTVDVQFADMLVHVYWHERISQKTAVTLTRIGHQNGDIGKPTLGWRGLAR